MSLTRSVPRHLALALALQQHKLPNGRIYLHAIHPRTILPAQTKRTILQVAGFYAALQHHIGTAPLAGFVTAINTVMLFHETPAISTRVALQI